MDSTVHHLDQYMFDFRQLITSGRKKIGLLIGAGAPMSMVVGGKPLIPHIRGLTEEVGGKLEESEREVYEKLKTLTDPKNIEGILSRARGLSEVIGAEVINGLDGSGYECLSRSICEAIKNIVDVELPKEPNPYSNLISWVNGITRTQAVEIFTTNYDLLFEEALEAVKTPFFDGFVGSKTAFFDPSSISVNNLPSNWIRLWKLHGSIGWSRSEKGDVVRNFSNDGQIMIYPSHVKYDQMQAAPFTSLFDRFKNFLLEPDTVLIVNGFSFADAHVASRVMECLAANSSSSIVALQYGDLADENCAVALALSRPNMSIYCRDGAVINGVEAKWKVGVEPVKNWERMRQEYWRDERFILGDFKEFAYFLAKSGGEKTFPKAEKEGGDDVSE